MTRYLISRISQAGLVVVGSVVLVFSLLHVVTEPADVALPIGASAASVAAFNEDYGFDKPLVPRLVAFLSDAEDVPLIVEVAAGGGPGVHAASSLGSVSQAGVTVSA